MLDREALGFSLRLFKCCVAIGRRLADILAINVKVRFHTVFFLQAAKRSARVESSGRAYSRSTEATGAGWTFGT